MGVLRLTAIAAVIATAAYAIAHELEVLAAAVQR